MLSKLSRPLKRSEVDKHEKSRRHSFYIWNDNVHDMESMRDYYTLKLNKIPKKYQPVLDREVSSWNLYKACRGLSIFYDGAKKLWVNVDDGMKELELDKLNIEVHGQENGYQLELEEFL